MADMVIWVLRTEPPVTVERDEYCANGHVRVRLDDGLRLYLSDGNARRLRDQLAELLADE